MNLSRRGWLRIVTAAAAALPMIPRLDSLAQSGAAPKRLLLVMSSSGTVAEQFWPTGGETTFAFPAGSILEPLEPHRSDVLIINNLNRIFPGQGGNHEQGVSCLWTGAPLASGGAGGAATGPSIDQIIAAELQPPTDFSTLEVGVQCDIGFNIAMSRMCYKGDNQPLEPENSPAGLYERLYGGLLASRGSSAERLRAERRSSLDLVSEELMAIRSRVGKEDVAKIDAHLEALRSVERRLDASGTEVCAVAPSGMLDHMANDNFPAVLTLQTDLVVSALACDRTRIASLQWSRGFSGTRFSWLGVGLGHHAASHELTMRPQLAQINRWYAEQFAYLLSQLKQVPELGGTLLDSSLVVYANELNEGSAHIPGPVPMVMAGSLGGAVRPGRYVDYGTGSPYTHNSMLVSICQAMGATNVQQVGVKDWAGSIPDLS